MDSVRSDSRPDGSPPWHDIPALLIGAAAVCSLISIAAMEILMGAALVALLVTRARWRIPPIWLPLVVFLALTLISLAAAGHIREGLPQVKKFFLYLMLFLVPSAVRTVRQVRLVAGGWAAAAAASSAWALNQFYNKYEDAKEAHHDFYRAYVADRITGFMDHWMTFSNQMMMALLVIAAIVFFSTGRRRVYWLVAAGALIAIALLLNETRSVWLATAAGGAYLIWCWPSWSVSGWSLRIGMLLAVPAVLAILVLINPYEIGDRILSPLRPHGNVDSTAHRSELRRIGWQMIKAHPWLGVGPEQVWRQAKSYMPPGVQALQPSEYYGHLENDYVQYAAERGVPAMLALMWMIAWALVDFGRALSRSGPAQQQNGEPERVKNRDGTQEQDRAKEWDGRWVLHAAIAVIVAVLVAGWFSWNLNASTVLGMFLAVIGCGYVAVMEPSPSREGGAS